VTSKGWDRLGQVKHIGTIDGFSRPNTEEERLNSIFLEVFSEGGGKAVLEYLKSVTVNAVLTPAQCEPNSLMHLEGQRYLVHLIDSRIEKGIKERSNGRRKSSS